MEWQVGFAAISIALGEPAERVLAALGSSADSVSQELHLRSENRLQRATTLARALAAVAIDLEGAEETWRS